MSILLKNVIHFVSAFCIILDSVTISLYSDFNEISETESTPYPAQSLRYSAKSFIAKTPYR